MHGDTMRDIKNSLHYRTMFLVLFWKALRKIIENVRQGGKEIIVFCLPGRSKYLIHSLYIHLPKQRTGQISCFLPSEYRFVFSYLQS